jgi:hypothetical protein
MTHTDDQPGDQPRDPRLAELMSDAVSDIEPEHRLDAIRNRTKVTSMSSRRPWLYAVGGAVIATAAVITAIAVAGGGLPGSDDDPDAATQTTEAAEETPSDEPSPEPSSEPPADDGEVVGVYFVGDTSAGPRLYREFLRSSGSDPIAFAVGASVSGDADDPDYRTLWPSGVSAADVQSDGGQITVALSGAPADLPSGMTADEAGIALQQVVYSAQAALGEGRMPVQIENADGGDQLLGESVAEPLNAASALKTLSHVSLSSPAEGQAVSGGSLQVEGVANSFEANVVVEIESTGDGSSGAGAGQPFTAEGWMGDKLFPFSGTLDLTGLAPGEYVVTASTDDPSGGEEGFGPFTDTRTITIE